LNRNFFQSFLHSIPGFDWRDQLIFDLLHTVGILSKIVDWSRSSFALLMSASVSTLMIESDGIYSLDLWIGKLFGEEACAVIHENSVVDSSQCWNVRILSPDGVFWQSAFNHGLCAWGIRWDGCSRDDKEVRNVTWFESIAMVMLFP
jgi:hypothetical protein